MCECARTDVCAQISAEEKEQKTFRETTGSKSFAKTDATIYRSLENVTLSSQPGYFERSVTLKYSKATLRLRRLNEL